MISSLMRWQELTRVWIGHWLSRPFHHLFNVMPGVEIGLSAPAITRLSESVLEQIIVSNMLRWRAGEPCISATSIWTAIAPDTGRSSAPSPT